MKDFFFSVWRESKGPSASFLSEKYAFKGYLALFTLKILGNLSRHFEPAVIEFLCMK